MSNEAYVLPYKKKLKKIQYLCEHDSSTVLWEIHLEMEPKPSLQPGFINNPCNQSGYMHGLGRLAIQVTETLDQVCNGYD